MNESDKTGQLVMFPELITTQYKDPSMNVTEERMLISHDHIVNALSMYLHSLNLWPYNGKVLVDADLGLELNDDGLVEIDLTLEDEVMD